MSAKKWISMVLSVAVVLLFFSPVIAAGTTDTIPTEAEYLELNAAILAASNDEEATAALDNMIQFYERVAAAEKEGLIKNAGDLYPEVINSYIQMNSTSLGSGNATFNYTVKAIIPSGAHVSLGYDYPGSLSVLNDRFSVSSSIGTYSNTISTGNYSSEIRLVGNFSASSFQSKVVYRQGYQYPFTGYSVSYHTVTTSEVVAQKVSLVFASVVGYLTIEGAAWKAVVTIAGLYSLSSIFNSIPSLVTGQYYVTKCWYASGRLYTRITVYNTYGAYQNSETPAYDGTSYVALPSF